MVKDIIDRYDVDGIHIDDYFYPYPANGKKFQADDASYRKFGNGMNRNDWRRNNVDLLIEQLHTTIKSEKPWVRFGVSPFGIWRNKSTDSRGVTATVFRIMTTFMPMYFFGRRMVGLIILRRSFTGLST